MTRPGVLVPALVRSIVRFWGRPGDAGGFCPWYGLWEVAGSFGKKKSESGFQQKIEKNIRNINRNFFPEGACNLPQPVPGAKAPGFTWSAPEPHKYEQAQEHRTPSRARLRTKYSASFSSPETPTRQVCPKWKGATLAETSTKHQVSQENRAHLQEQRKQVSSTLLGRVQKKVLKQKNPLLSSFRREHPRDTETVTVRGPKMAPKIDNFVNLVLTVNRCSDVMTPSNRIFTFPTFNSFNFRLDIFTMFE